MKTFLGAVCGQRKSVFLFLALFVSLCSWAETLVTNPATEMTDGVYISLQCKDTNGGDGYYFSGAEVKTPSFTLKNIYRIADSDGAGFTLQRVSDGKYVGKSENSITMSADKNDAAVFSFAMTQASGWSSPGVGVTAESQAVRFTTAGVYLNAQGSDNNPVYAGGQGGWSIWWVSTYSKQEVLDLSAKVSHGGWSITACNTCPDNYEGVDYDGNIKAAIDGSTTTFYHSDWTGTQPGKTGTQAFLIDMGEDVNIFGFNYSGRPNSSSGHAYTCRVYVYADGNKPADIPNDLSDLAADAKDGILSSTNANLGTPAFNNSDAAWTYSANTDVQTGLFTGTTGRYILFIQDSGSDEWLTCADFNVYTAYEESALVPISGKVSDISGNGMSSVVVTDGTYKAVTKNDGTYRLLAPSGTYTLYAKSGDAYSSEYLQGVDNSAGEVTNQNITYAYTINFNPTAVYHDNRTSDDRNVTAIGLKSSDVDKSLTVPFDTYATTNNYQNICSDEEANKFVFNGKTTVTPYFTWTGTWMHGFVYIDYNNNGVFEESELVSYDTTILNDNNKKPAFVLPNNGGTYRIRYKVDWESTESGGSGDILANGGSITDAYITINAVSEVPEVSDLTSNPTDAKFYLIRNQRANNRHATYTNNKELGTSINLSDDATAYSVWYFVEDTEATVGDAGTKAVKVYNIMKDGALHNPVAGVDGTSSTYYMFEHETGGQKGFCLSLTDKTTANDAWNDYQGSHTSVREWNYDDAGSIWQAYPISTDEAWALVQQTLKDETGYYADSYFAPTSKTISTTVDGISYDTSKTPWGNVSDARTVVAAIAPEHTEFPAAGGRFLVKNRLRTEQPYLTDNNPADVSGLACTADKDLPANVWEFIPSGDQYKLRNRATGHFLNNDGLKAAIDRDEAKAWTINVEDSKYISIKSGNYLCIYGSLQVGTWFELGEDMEWLIYEVGTDMVETGGSEFLIQNTGTKGGYITYAGDDTNITQHVFADISENSVWTLESGTDDVHTTDYLLTSCGNTTVKCKSVNEFTAEGANVFFTFAESGKYYSIADKAGTSGYGFWNNDGSAGEKIVYYWAGDANGFFRVDKLDRVVDDARYDLKAFLGPLADNVRETDFFFINKGRFDLWSGWVGEEATTASQKLALIQKIRAFLAKGLVDTDYNIPANDVYRLINNKYPDRHIMEEDGSVITTVKEHGKEMFFYFTFTETDGNVTATIVNKSNNEYVQQANTSVLVQTAAEEHSFDIVPAPEGRYGCVAMGNGGYTFLHNDGGNDVVGWSCDAEASAWKIQTLKDPTDILIANARDAIQTSLDTEADPTKATEFVLTPAGRDAVQAAIEAIVGASGTEEHYSYEHYATLEDALKKNLNYYYQLADGRYLVRNYEHETDKETFVTSLTNVMSVVEGAVNYWSIWDIKSLGNGEYEMVNVGNRDIVTPTKTTSSANSTDLGYLHYNPDKAGATKFEVGDCNPANEPNSIKTMVFSPVTTLFPNLAGNYAIIRPKNGPGKEVMYVDNHQGSYDHILKSAAYNNVGVQCLFQFIPVNTVTITDEFGTHEGESEMFAREVENLVGHVGGIVTLDNVASLPVLNNIKTFAQSASTAIADGSSFTYDGVSYSSGSKMYRKLIEMIETVKNDSENSVYYQDLRPTDYTYMSGIYTKAYTGTVTENGDGTFSGVVDGNTVALTKNKHPFFLETMCGARPEYGGRLTRYAGEYSWHTDLKASVNDMDGTFYVKRSAEVVDYTYVEDGQQINANGNYYVIANGNNEFLKAGTDFVGTTTVESEALKFVITPVVPGIWQIQDIEPFNSSYPYVTITNPSADCALKHYNLSEISTLWRFQTFNELDDIILKVDPDHKVDGNYYATFSYPLNIKVPKSQNAVPHYCSNAYKSSSVANLRVVFEPVPDNPSDPDYYYLEGNQGYMFVAASGKSNQENGEMVIHGSEFITGSIPADCQVNDRNLLVPNLLATYVTNETWANTYALTYNSNSTIVGKYNGSFIYGIGMGFYHLPIGGRLKPQTAYIKGSSFVDGDVSISTGVKESGMPAEMLFENEFGTTEVISVNDGTLSYDTEDLYDIVGRRITKPTKGIYIKNGKKFMYK